LVYDKWPRYSHPFGNILLPINMDEYSKHDPTYTYFSHRHDKCKTRVFHIDWAKEVVSVALEVQ
jgi:hypothetical protein